MNPAPGYHLATSRARCQRLHGSLPSSRNGFEPRRPLSRFCVESSDLRGVAQSGSAPGWGPGGRRFKSCLPDSK